MWEYCGVLDKYVLYERKQTMDNGRKMSFVIFLDVDGVLNTVKTCVHTPEGYTGVDDARVLLLAKAMKQVGADGVVLTST